MALSYEQVEQMAPDAASLATGKKLEAAKHWKSLGHSALAVWGECQGSALYQVKIDASNWGYNCSCPSRKFPCKHVLGLLFGYASNASAFTNTNEPEWITSWLEKRQATAAKKEAKANEPPKPVDEKAQAKRAEQRHDRVSAGLERLDIWLRDLVRGGLAGLETKGSEPWEEQAKRLVDAQAPGLAARLRRLGELPGSTTEWPTQLLGELGRIKLAIHAYQRIDQLPVDLASDLKQWIGWTVTSDELEKTGEKVEDDWLILGQWIEEEDRLKAQRTWCLGRNSKRLALVLQFVVGSGAFPVPLTPGTQQKGTMLFYPGAGKQRAQFAQRVDAVTPIASSFPGHASIEAWLATISQQLARQPWLHAFGVALQQVTLVRHNNRWFIRDASGAALPMQEMDAWKLFAQSGGEPFDLVGEWSGQRLRLLGLFLQGRYRLPV